MRLLFLVVLLITVTSCESINLDLLKSQLESQYQPMVTTWRVGDGGFGDGDNSISLPLVSGYDYNFTVNWGDGTSSEITSDTDSDITHIYAIAGDYTVTIDGLAEAWSFGNDVLSDKDKIISVDNFGAMGWIDLSGAFYGCSNLTSFVGGDTSNVTNMSSMFHENSSLVSLDLSHFDTSKVVDMSTMFKDSIISNLNISSFDTSSVLNMTEMFRNLPLTVLDVSHFNTSNVTNMTGLFYGLLVASLNLSNFETSNVTTMALMFKNMPNLVNLDLTSFDTSSVTSMYQMFISCPSLESLNLNGLDTSNVVSAYAIFAHNSSLVDVDLTGWDVGSVTNSGAAWLNVNSSVALVCDEGGSPGTGSIFGKNCD